MECDFQILTDEVNNTLRDCVTGSGGDPTQVQAMEQRLIAAVRHKIERSSQMIHVGLCDENVLKT